MSKPLTESFLKRALQRVVGDRRRPQSIELRDVSATKATPAAVKSEIAREQVSVAAGTTEVSVLDEAALSQLRGAMGERFPAMLDCFLEDAASYASRLNEAARSGEIAEVRRLAHSLKSSSILFGAQSISHEAAKLEAMAADLGDQDADQFGPQDLEPLLSAVRQGLETLRELRAA